MKGLPLSRRRLLVRAAAAGLALFAAVTAGASGPIGAAEIACPQCGAPREPGAAFCVRCGHRFAGDAGAPPAAAPATGAGSVVQVITAHDSELTSTFGSLAFESNVRVDSILGSAFAVGPGEFVTDAGLLVGAKEVSLRLASGRSVPARVVGSDPMIGVALLAAETGGIDPLPLRDAEPPRTGESLRAVGFPSGTGAGGAPIVSDGVLSGQHRSLLRVHPIEDYLQTDASLPRGFAGAPVLDARGRVAGMSTSLVFGARVSLGPEGGIGMAIPAAWISRALTWIRSGAPPRAWLGACALPADFEVRRHYDLPSDVKLVVDVVFPGSPAAEAGLRRGDGLVAIRGEPCDSLIGVQERLLAMKAGEPIAVVFARGKERLDRTLTPVPRPEKPRPGGLDALRFFGDVDVEPAGGDRLVVASVSSGSDLSRLNVSSGDVLQSVLSKKDWEHGARDNSRWRGVRTVADLESRLATAYSDLDFCLGLRFRTRDGSKRELFVWEVLTPSPAL